MFSLYQSYVSLLLRDHTLCTYSQAQEVMKGRRWINSHRAVVLGVNEA